MSHQPEARMFWFRGNAVALGGQLVSPVCETLDAQGSSVLPPTGGFASASVDRFNFKNIVSFERASSTVAGRVSEHDGRKTYDTQVTVAIEGLNVLDMVTADRVVARLTSTHPHESNDPEMLPIGSYFENLRIAGIPIEARPHVELLRAGRYIEVSKVCAESFPGAPDERESPKTPSVSPMPDWKPGAPSPVFDDRFLLAPLFDAGDEKVRSTVGAAAGDPRGIHVPGFGTIYIGEYLISRFSRRLTMLRIELGCPVKGTIVAASEEIDGHDYP